MTKLSPNPVVPIGLVILVATVAFFGHGLDPDEQFVAQTNLPVGKLSFEVLEDKTGVHLPARLFFAYVDGRPDVPTVGRFQNILVTASGREVKTIPAGEYDVYISRGFEYSLDHQRVAITEGKMAYLTSTLSRVINTTGFISSAFAQPMP